MIQRLGMMVVAIIFPELIISAAWRQLRLSQWLCSEVNRLRIGADGNDEQGLTEEPDVESRQREYTHTNMHIDSSPRMLLPLFDFEPPSNNTSDPDRHSSGAIPEQDQARSRISFPSPKKSHNIIWTIEQGFFVTMGGFAVESTYRDKQNQKVTMRRLLTAEGIACLARVGLLPSVNHDDIEDRSKADMIAKMFVLSQVIWFGSQVVARLASKLPVTPLEGHTAVHVGCAIVMYLVWFKKPYNLIRSILLEGEDVADMAALFNFYDITRTVYARKEVAYAKEREAYWNSG
ncbi:MAG: hypothetical protein LQ347_005783 [Umbilicaria vellea]|nr:MAG: hypothetical protein LQ347_005783 [Umbilicaria vellea]